jgi:hypothetical protein
VNEARKTLGASSSRITKRASGSSDTDARASSLGVAWALTQLKRIARPLWMWQRPVRNVHQNYERCARRATRDGRVTRGGRA